MPFTRAGRHGIFLIHDINSVLTLQIIKQHGIYVLSYTSVVNLLINIYFYYIYVFSK